MELKTLKDLEGKFAEHFSEKFPASAEKEIIDMLKAEAIKWVKDIDIGLKGFEQYQGQVIKNAIADKVQGLIATRQWILNFFNITEEDLK